MLDIKDTIAISVDIQEKLVPVMHEKEQILNKASTLIKGLNVLNVPILVPRQYPKGIGDTQDCIKDVLKEHTPIDKTSFGCLGETCFNDELHKYAQKSVIVFGIEAHVCVLQTVLGLLEQGYQVYLVCDAITSRHEYDKLIAIERAKQAGVLLTTVESILFELMKSSKHEKFKEISKIIK